MIVVSGERNILIGIFSGRLVPTKDGREINSLDDTPNAEVCAIYFEERDNKMFPDLLVVDTPNMQEFFAWSSTYLPQWSPLSSNIQIVEKQNLSEDLKSPTQKKIPTQFFRGLLCLTIGELLYEWRLANGHSLPSLLSLRSTFGYAATCSLLSNRNCLDDLLSKWVRSQHLLQLNPRRINSKTLKSVWSPIFSLLKSNLDLNDLSATVKDLANIVSRKSQGKLFDENDIVKNTRRRDRREDVVIELENFISATKLDRVIDCFEVSRIASRMSASPLSHFDVLDGMTNSEPRSLLWYSFLSGLLATDTASLTIERLLFQLEGDLRTKPILQSDISIDELEALMGPSGQLPDWVGIGARFINVELGPNICSAFRLRIPTTTDDSHVVIAPVDDKQLFERLLSQLREVYERKIPSPQKNTTGKPRKRKTRKKGKS